MKIGTGFVFDDFGLETSPQIDIIVYDDTTLSPIFRTGDLIVVRPEQVYGIIEVKKKIKISDIDELIDKYFFVNTGSEFQETNGIQVINIFSFQKSASLIKYYERTISAIERNLLQIRSSENPNLLRPIKSITVPRLFFLDSHQIINTSLIVDNLRHKVNVSLQNVPYSSGGASDLFSRFIWQNKSIPSEKLLFSTVGIYTCEHEHLFETPVILRDFISVSQLLSQFSKEDISKMNLEKLKKFYGFYLPYGFKFLSLGEFNESVKTGILVPVPNR